MLKPRLILMGTGGFALPSFESVRQHPAIEIVAVVTKPVMNLQCDPKSKELKGTEAKGKFQKPLANPVRSWADTHSLRIYTPDSINQADAIDWLVEQQADLLFVCDYGQILSKVALGTAKHGGINLHGSLLPRHRGAAPVQWSLLRGDTESGVTVIHMTPKLDGGPILSQAKIAISPVETAEQLETRLSQLGIECAMRAIELLLLDPEKLTPEESKNGLMVEQDTALITPAPRLSKLDGQIDCRYDVGLIYRQYRALQPWPGLYGTMIDDQLRALRVIFGEVAPMAITHPTTVDYGQMIWGDKAMEVIGPEHWRKLELEGIRTTQLLLIACKHGYLRIQRIQPAGKKMLTSGEFLAGYGRNQFLSIAHPSEVPSHSLLEKIRLEEDSQESVIAQAMR